MTQGLEIRSTVTRDGDLILRLEQPAMPLPAPDEIVVRMEAAPINPSDLMLLLGGADVETIKLSEEDSLPVLRGRVPAEAMLGLAARLDQAMTVGNEGAGTVVAAGSSEGAQALLGRLVAVGGGNAYTRFRLAHLDAVLALPEGATAADGASSYVNPMTALGMIETMRAEGHSALVHTAAASNLGQMLNRICLKDGIGLVNIVRSAEQAATLTQLGAAYVVDSSAANFEDRLTDAIAATGATIGFDAIGGGKLAGQILTAMEAAIARKGGEYSRYGSSVLKQVYIYGGLDAGATVFNRTFGLTWSIAGWFLTNFVIKIGPDAAMKLRQRVAQELTTTFTSNYARTISLREALAPETIKIYAKRATGAKYLIDPSIE